MTIIFILFEEGPIGHVGDRKWRFINVYLFNLIFIIVITARTRKFLGKKIREGRKF